MGKMEDTLEIAWALQFSEYLFNKLFNFFKYIFKLFISPIKI